MERKKVLIIGIIALLIAVSAITSYFLLYKTEKTEEIILKPSSKKQPIQTSELKIEFPTYTYDAQQLRDPFAPLIVKRQDRKKGVSALESYDIEEFKLTGIAKDNKGAFALLQASDGRFYIVREKDRIGYSGGIVIKILKDSIEVKEGNKVKYLRLRTEEEG